MMIVDAIRSAATHHAVYFLATAYIESLRHFERSSGVPAEALELPLGDSADLERRAQLLERHTAAPLEAMVAIAELCAVIASAIERLSVLEEPQARVIPSARSDTRRSALSV